MTSYLTFNKALSSTTSFEQSAAKTGDLALENKWTLWRQQKDDQDYKNSMKPVVTVSTAAEFWRAFNHLPQPSHVLLASGSTAAGVSEGACEAANEGGCSFMLFREGVRPEWEDPANTGGGHFQFSLSLSGVKTGRAESNGALTAAAAQLDEYWNNLVLSTIGHSFPNAQLVTGLRLVDKTKPSKPSSAEGRPSGHIRVELWFSAASDMAVVELRRGVEFALRSRLDGTLGELIIRVETRKHEDRVRNVRSPQGFPAETPLAGL